MNKKLRAQLMELDQEVFLAVMTAKWREQQNLRKNCPKDEADLEVLIEYGQKIQEYTELQKIHRDRENFKPGSLAYWDTDDMFYGVGRIDDEWHGDVEYVMVGDLPHYEGDVDDLKAITPEVFQEWVRFQPAHYLQIYKDLDLHKEPGYENIVFPEEFQETKEVILDLKELGI
jgi:hypothetical protein